MNKPSLHFKTSWNVEENAFIENYIAVQYVYLLRQEKGKKIKLFKVNFQDF